MNRVHIGLRLLAREWRAGELRLLAFALVIAVASVTLLGFFADRLGRAMTAQSADLLGGDLLLSSPRPVADDWLQAARRRGLRTAVSLSFASVITHGDALELAGVQAVGAGFPLRGALRTAPRPYAADAATAEIPDPGTAWAEARLFSALRVHVGDTLGVGAATLRLTRVLTYSPGKGGSLFLAPRLLINRTDLPATQLLQPGSRVTYEYLFAGPPALLQGYGAWLRSRLGPSHELTDVRRGRPAVGAALQRAQRYLGLASLTGVLLAAVAVAMAAQRHSRRHFDVAAMLRCFGATQRDVLAIYIPQLFGVGIVASTIGCVLGWLAQQGLVALLSGLLPKALPPPGPAPVLLGLLTGLVTLAGFGLPPVLRLREVPPLRVLRRDLLPLPRSGWVTYVAALAAMVLLTWGYAGEWRLTLAVLAGVAAVAVTLSLLALGLLRLAQPLRKRVGVAWRFGLNNLWRRAGATVGQILAFALILMAMGAIALLRTDLLHTWQAQLPPDTPNYFAINILPQQVERVGRFLEHHALHASELYPMVRGRLTGIDGRPVSAAGPSRDQPEALRRELNLTWAGALPSDNAVVAGHWWRDNRREPEVSVEAELASRLGIRLGDTLEFSIGDARLSAHVTSLRSVQWDSFRPNFYMIFPPGALDGYPATYVTSFHLPTARDAVLAELVRTFPSVTVLDIGQILHQVRLILQQVTVAVEYVLLFVLIAGLAVLYAALQSSQDERLHEGALLRAFGASRRQLRAAHLAEFTMLGLGAGLLAALGTELVVYLLYTQVFELEFEPHALLWLALPLAGAAVVGGAGYWGTRAVVRQSPMSVLQRL